MAKFLVRRILQGLLVLWLITLAVFALFFITPNDVARTLAGKNASPEMVANVAKRLGLDKPVWEQYLTFLGNALHGDLGYDYYHDLPVTEMIAKGLPVTISLVLGASVLWLLIGVTNGVVSAVKPRSFVDRFFTVFALFFYSLPTFLLGLYLLYLLYYQLTMKGILLFPAGGYVAFGSNPIEWARHLILPWFTLALVSAATYTRLTRSSMLDVLGEDYIRTARSKGISERSVVFKHALRSALTPIVTQFGIDVGVLLGGAIVTEKLFGLPGLGFTAIDAINQNDLPVIIGIVLFASTCVVVANILVDIAYALLDPRVRLN